jgi:hypothetical protein
MERDYAYGMSEQVIFLKSDYKDRLGSVRHIPGWAAATNAEGIWLKGPQNNSSLQTALSSLPAETTYITDADGRLFPAGKRTPVRLLPVLNWQPLREFIPLEMPVSAMPGKIEQQINVQLARSTSEKELCALQVSLADWQNYAATAPEVRLNQLRFAVSENNEVLVIGTPLPLLQGTYYWRHKNCLLPAGFDFDPPYVAALLPETMGFTVFDTHGAYQTIPDTAFLNAGRALIRSITS